MNGHLPLVISRSTPEAVLWVMTNSIMQSVMPTQVSILFKENMIGVSRNDPTKLEMLRKIKNAPNIRNFS